MRSAGLISVLAVALLGALVAPPVGSTGVVVLPVLSGSTATVAATAATAAVVGGALAGAGALAVGAKLARKRNRRRGRRAVEDESAEVESAEVESAVWQLVGAHDHSNCVQKLICLLEAAAAGHGATIDSSEQQVLAFVGDLSGPVENRTASRLLYDSAGLLGKYRGQLACDTVYGVWCDHSRQQMMQLIQQVWTDVDEGIIPVDQQ